MDITDDMCRRAVKAMEPDRIQGFSTPSLGDPRTWGPPHYIRDVWLPTSEQELWRGDSHDEMMERSRMEEMRLALRAALNTPTHQMTYQATDLIGRLRREGTDAMTKHYSLRMWQLCAEAADALEQQLTALVEIEAVDSMDAVETERFEKALAMVRAAIAQSASPGQGPVKGDEHGKGT